jgi:PRC-barrel domain
MTSEKGHQTLCYLEAARVASPVGSLDGARLQCRSKEIIGRLEGVLIDPSERRLRFYVVKSVGWFRNKRYLLPADRIAQIEPVERTLRLDVDSHELKRCDEFDSEEIREFSDEDVVTAMFAQPGVAEPPGSDGPDARHRAADAA